MLVDFHRWATPVALPMDEVPILRKTSKKQVVHTYHLVNDENVNFVMCKLAYVVADVLKIFQNCGFYS